MPDTDRTITASGHRTRLGLDLGTNSIGWCLIEIDTQDRVRRVIDGGVRRMTPSDEAGRDPKSKQSLAADRRLKRQMRRRRERFKRRQQALIRALTAGGLMPRDHAERRKLDVRDPYALRAEALNRALTPYELGRALFHLNQRRGFQANRIAEGDEDGAMKAGMARLREALEEPVNGKKARTLGEWQYLRLQEETARLRDPSITCAQRTEVFSAREGVRFRPRKEGAKTVYGLYPDRAMVEHELNRIIEAQLPHHPVLAGTPLADVDERRRNQPTLADRIKHIIIDQRPLKAQLAGRCTLNPAEERAPKALASFQRFRILADLATVRVERPGRRSRPLNVQERDMLAGLLMGRASEVKWDAMRKALANSADWDAECRLNYENTNRKGFDPDLVAATMAGPKVGFKAWRGLDRVKQDAIIRRLLTEEDTVEVVAFLCAELSVDEETAAKIAAVRLPQGYGNLGETALGNLNDAMENEITDWVDPDTGEVTTTYLGYDDAVRSAYGDRKHHSDLHPGKDELFDRLPYYGDVLTRQVIARPNAPEGSMEARGRVPNPTVHIGLNQLRRVVNAIIEEYGKPDEIVIELGRELKMTKDQKDKRTKQQAENTKANERRKKVVAELNAAYRGKTADDDDVALVEFGGETRLRMRLYDELPADERVCVYSGRPITQTDLFNGSVEVDHILPFSQTLDDGFSNKVLCFIAANREKGARTPAEAFDEVKAREIEERAERLFPGSKAWRFKPDAMERFLRDHNDFLARQLTDSQHLARLAKTYLSHIVPDNKVWAVPGKLTATLRGLWGLDHLLGTDNAPRGRKNRNDHRHHLVDAFVIACATRGYLKRISDLAAQAEGDIDGARLFRRQTVPAPWDVEEQPGQLVWPDGRNALREVLAKTVVSHRADHGIDPKAKRNGSAQTTGRLHEETAYGPADDAVPDIKKGKTVLNKAEEPVLKTFELVTRKAVGALSANDIDQVRDHALRKRLQTLRDKTLDISSSEGLSKAQAEKRLADALSSLAASDRTKRADRGHRVRCVRVLKRDDVRWIENEALAVTKPKADDLDVEVTFETKRHRKAYAKGDNQRLHIFEKDGVWRGEGVSVWEANDPGFTPFFRYDPDAHTVMTLHKNDMIAADFGGGEKIYRVTVLEPSANRVRVAEHHEGGRLDERHFDQDDPYKRFLPSYKTLQAANARPVKVDVLGRVWAGNRRLSPRTG